MVLLCWDSEQCVPFEIFSFRKADEQLIARAAQIPTKHLTCATCVLPPHVLLLKLLFFTKLIGEILNGSEWVTGMKFSDLDFSSS